MNRVVANGLLSKELAAYRQLGSAQLANLAGECTSNSRRGADGMDYTDEVSVRWRSNAETELVVSGSVSPADWGSPHDLLCESFVVQKAPPGSA